jgi:exodeoxyribonuclease VII small subunit
MPAASKKANSESGSSDLDSLTFEQALEQLEAIVARMEDGSLSLEQSLAAYQNGAALLTRCRTSLENVEQQIKVLENGVLKPFETGNADE